MHRLIPLFFTFLLASAFPLAAEPLRPTTITWGGVDGNDQFIGSEGKWPFVQKYMDGFVMHGFYWQGHSRLSPAGVTTPEAVHAAEVALGAALKDSGKEVSLETILGAAENRGYDPAQAAARDGYRTSRKVIKSLHEFDAAGIHVNKVRLDWFPLNAMSMCAGKFQTTDVRDLLVSITGADAILGRPVHLAPELANWREYVTAVHAAFPDIAFGFDQAPCNFRPVPPDPALRSLVPWAAFGYGYNMDFCDTVNKPVLINGAPRPIKIDFADILNSVSLATRSWGLKFSGFEADTPYTFVDKNLGAVGKNLVPFLLAMERSQHQAGFRYGKFINDYVRDPSLLPDAWDKRYHDRSLQFLETYQSIGGRADQYIFESWYVGPFTLFPETKDGTYTNLVRDAIRRVRGIDDQGQPFHADLAIRAANDPAFIGEHVYQAAAANEQLIHVPANAAAPTYEIRVTNDGTEVNRGDCRATPLVRADATLPITARDADKNDITSQLLAQGESDGWFVGGLEPGQSRSFTLTLPPGTKSGAVHLRLYWNPQDPEALVRDAITIDH